MTMIYVVGGGEVLAGGGHLCAYRPLVGDRIVNVVAAPRSAIGVDAADNVDLLIDGHGRAHPRLFGIACHIGVLFDKPAIGCGKSLLVGEHDEPATAAGSTSPLWFKGERVGEVLRTRAGVRSIYVTIGHRVSLNSAVEFVRRCSDGFRIPKPTREADHYVGELRRKFQT